VTVELRTHENHFVVVVEKHIITTTLPHNPAMANALEVTPDSELQFVLSRAGDVTPKTTLTLRHPGTTDEYLAFKVCMAQYAIT
jgi:hypothetical protein